VDEPTARICVRASACAEMLSAITAVAARLKVLKVIFAYPDLRTGTVRPLNP
jgi:hypothetical protein